MTDIPYLTKWNVISEIFRKGSLRVAIYDINVARRGIELSISQFGKLFQPFHSSIHPFSYVRSFASRMPMQRVIPIPIQ